MIRGGNFKPLEPIDLPENTPMTVALLDSDDLSTHAIAELARNGAAFDFLLDPLENIYSETDGEPV